MTKKQDQQKPTETPQEEIKTISIKIGNITTGKSMILSFTDSKKKQLDMTPFQLKPKTNDGYYDYSHHLDLREGKGDIEKWNKKHKSLFIPYSILSKTETYKGITEQSYTQLMRYYFYDLIINGKMDIEGKNKNGDTIHLKIEWTGEKIDQPTIKKIKEKKDKDKTSKKDLLEGLEF